MKETIKKCLSKRILALAMALAVSISMMPATAVNAAAAPPTKKSGSLVDYYLTCHYLAGRNPSREYTVIDKAHEAYFRENGFEEGWYLVEGNVSLSTNDPAFGFFVTGDVNLVLADDCELSVNGFSLKLKDMMGNYESGSLTIWGGDKGNGKLITPTGILLTNLTINGGEVEANGYSMEVQWEQGSGIVGWPGISADESVTINGGKVTAKKGDGVSYTGDAVVGAIESDGTVTITGGTVEATGDYGIFGKKGINIIGGEVTATGGNSASALGTDASEGGKINIKSSATVVAGDAAPGSAIAYDAYTSQKYAKVSYPASKHNWSYTADGAKLMASCSRKDICTQEGITNVSLTLSATSTEYTGKPVVATVSDTSEWKAWTNLFKLSVPTIKYAGTGTTVYAESETAPTKAGKYIASITAEGATASVAFEITGGAKEDGPDFPYGLTGYDTSKAGGNDGKVTGVNTTMEYSLDDGKTWKPVTGTEITGLSAGVVLVRVKETDTTLAGKIATLNILDGNGEVKPEVKPVVQKNETSYKVYTKKSTVNVPKTVKKGGKTYTVTSVKKNAFDGKYVKKVVFPSTVTKIGSEAFSKDNKLRSIKISSKKLTIGKNLFNGIKKKNLAKIKVTVSKKMSKKDFNALEKKLVKQGLKAKNIVRK